MSAPAWAVWWWKLARLPVALIVGTYIIAAALAPFIAPHLMYYPQFGSRRAPDGLRKIRAADGNDIAILHLPNPRAQFTLWFFHGNAEDLGDDEPVLQALREMGFAVFAFDYPGYGVSTGRPGEDSCYAAARAARAYLRDVLHVPAERTILFGRSLGGGIATQMATEERVGGLVLQSAFVSAFRVMTRWPLFPFDQYQNAKKLPRVSCPVLVMHGQADEVIGPWHGEALFAVAREPKRALWVPAARHNDFFVTAGDKLGVALREFSELCATVAPRTR